MKKTILSFLSISILLLAVFAVVPVCADTGITYESLLESYGEAKENYIYTVKYGDDKECNVAYCEKPVDAEIYTETNIRKGPDLSAERITTLHKGTKVKVWGAADKNWLKVYVKTDDGNNLFGYIWWELLNPPA